MDKLLSVCVFLLSLYVLLVSAEIIGSVEENRTVYIRADGSVEGTDIIVKDANIYTFTTKVCAPIVVEKDYVVIDGAGYSLQGNGIGTGINLTARTNVTVKNIEIVNFFYGIYLNFSLNNNLSNNNVKDNFYGVYLSASSNNTIFASNITKNDSSGVWLRCSSNNEINKNRIIENGQDGIWLSCSSDNNKVTGNIIGTNGYGIRIDDYSNNMLRNNELTDNLYNFGVFGSLLPEFVQDIDDSNIVNGKPICYWINIHEMTVPLDAGYVALVNCSAITVKNLNLNNNGQGLVLASTTETSIIQNNITDNIHGIYLCESANNTVTENNITKNAANGIYLYYSENNTFFYNDFIFNTNPAYNVGDLPNIWDNGVEGNHWSNYEENFPNATELDSSGIWNTPYVLDGNNQDNYPLLNVTPEFSPWIILPLQLSLRSFAKRDYFQQIRI